MLMPDEIKSAALGKIVLKINFYGKKHLLISSSKDKKKELGEFRDFIVERYNSITSIIKKSPKDYIYSAPKKEKPEFHGIYRISLTGKKIEVYCPICGSENCSYYQEQKIIPGKTKTRYTANLNPLRPFTLVNTKEKVIRKEEVVTESKIVCNECGHTFI